MTGAEIITNILQAFGFLALYLFIGFGPGFVIGLMMANLVIGRGKPTLMQKHTTNKQLAAQHNAQWNPAHERWQKPK
ncbi:hypothetical protein IH781_00995 [Patescibacteria group bacterium]|nr:hypothetical protein [Patescibacteria group bacterium]